MGSVLEKNAIWGGKPGWDCTAQHLTATLSKKRYKGQVKLGPRGALLSKGSIQKGHKSKGRGSDSLQTIMLSLAKGSPPKVELMAWMALLRKLNTKDRLATRGIISAELNKFTFCNNHIEDLNHLLLSCQTTWGLWKAIAEDLGEEITLADNLRDFFAYWINRRIVNKTQRKLWLASFFATLWSLWMHRNEIIFKQHTMDMQAIYHTIKWRVATWSRAWEDDIPYSAQMLAHNFQALPLLFH